MFSKREAILPSDRLRGRETDTPKISPKIPAARGREANALQISAEIPECAQAEADIHPRLQALEVLPLEGGSALGIM